MMPAAGFQTETRSLVAAVVLCVAWSDAGEAPTTHDLWKPWRQEARLASPPYRVADEMAARSFSLNPNVTGDVVRFPSPDVRLPLTIDLADFPLTETAGVELRFRFRVAQVPPARLDSSQSLAKFILAGTTGDRGFYLHAYSRNSGFFLNGLAAGKDRPKQQVRLLRGAATPHEAVRWDTQWHTVCLAWSRGQLAASWDGLPILHITEPGIDYHELSLLSVTPDTPFGTLELSGFEARKATF